jgi:hypothetical protein
MNFLSRRLLPSASILVLPVLVMGMLLMSAEDLTGPESVAVAARAAKEEQDAYGGLKAVSSRASGYFRTERIGGRWWLVTPDGHAFLSSGVNHVDYKEDYSPDFVSFVTRHLRQWGFNTIGWSQESMSPTFQKGKVRHSRGWSAEQYRVARMPYTHLIRFTDMEWYAEEEFPDVFSTEFERKCDRLAREICVQLRDDPYLIGYFYSDTPNWPLWAEQAGQERIAAVARRYYEVIGAAIRRYDPNHLILGDRLKADGDIPIGNERVRGVIPPVLEAMRDTVDVLSLEYYRPDSQFEENLEAWSALAGKPVLLADSAFLAPTDVLQVPSDSAVYVASQMERGERYRAFARRIYSNPVVIGWHWCAFGRSPGRRSGLLDGEDRPYRDCVERMGAFNREELYRVALDPRTSGAVGQARSDSDSGNPDHDRDRFGGTRAVRSQATGFFRVEKSGGRWWFFTPEGNGFISMGMNHFDLSALKHEDNIQIFRERYGGNNDRFIMEGIARPLREWGFNSIGWTQESVSGRWLDNRTLLRHSPEWSPRELKLAGLPYIYNLHFADIEFFNANPFYPDVFDEDFEQWADYVARSVCLEMRDDPMLIGYADVPIPAFTRNAPGSWAEGLELDKPEDRGKLERIVRRYFEVTTRAIRRYDPNHMIFGPRFDHPPNTPEWIIGIAGEYFDVILCNLFVTEQDVDTKVLRWHQVSGRPVLLSDMAFLAPTRLLRVSPGSDAYVPDQKARGKRYQEFASNVLIRPYIIGWHWCAFIENRARKSGIKDYLDEPYWECVEAMRKFNLDRLYSTVLGKQD